MLAVGHAIAQYDHWATPAGLVSAKAQISQPEPQSPEAETLSDRVAWVQAFGSAYDVNAMDTASTAELAASLLARQWVNMEQSSLLHELAMLNAEQPSFDLQAQVEDLVDQPQSYQLGQNLKRLHVLLANFSAARQA